jgi:hypothetical protein
LVGGLVGAQDALFSFKLLTKKCRNFTFYVWRAVCWCLPKKLGRWLVKHFRGFFHQIKVRQQIGREDSIQAVRMRRLEGFLYEAATNLKKF